MMNTTAGQSRRPAAKRGGARWRTARSKLWKSRYLYIMIFPVVVYFIVFHYMPMYGAQIAFRDFNPFLGILESPWAGFKYFQQFFDSVFFWRLMRNTLVINLLSILISFPAPIILALMINEVANARAKKCIQTVVYLPHFISIVVVAGMVISFLSTRGGIVNSVIEALGGDPVQFMSIPGYFPAIYVLSDVWQEAGWGSIIYLSAITSIDDGLYEAAIIDGASRLKQVLYVTLPCITPTIIIMFILKIGGLFTVGFEKIMLLYSPLTYETADVISTYVYRRGIEGMEYSFSTAVGLFNSVLNMVMLVLFNTFSKKVTDTSLW